MNRKLLLYLSLLIFSFEINSSFGQSIYDDKKIQFIDGVEYKSKIHINDKDEILEIVTYLKKTNDSITTTKFYFSELFRGGNFYIYNSIIRLEGGIPKEGFNDNVVYYDFINKEKYYTNMWFYRGLQYLKIGKFNPLIEGEGDEVVLNVLDEHLNVYDSINLNPTPNSKSGWILNPDSDVINGVIKLYKNITPKSNPFKPIFQGYTYYCKSKKLIKNVK